MPYERRSPRLQQEATTKLVMNSLILYFFDPLQPKSSLRVAVSLSPSPPTPKGRWIHEGIRPLGDVCGLLLAFFSLLFTAGSPLCPFVFLKRLSPFDRRLSSLPFYVSARSASSPFHSIVFVRFFLFQCIEYPWVGGRFPLSSRQGQGDGHCLPTFTDLFVVNPRVFCFFPSRRVPNCLVGYTSFVRVWAQVTCLAGPEIFELFLEFPLSAGVEEFFPSLSASCGDLWSTRVVFSPYFPILICFRSDSGFFISHACPHGEGGFLWPSPFSLPLSFSSFFFFFLAVRPCNRPVTVSLCPKEVLLSFPLTPSQLTSLSLVHIPGGAASSLFLAPPALCPFYQSQVSLLSGLLSTGCLPFFFFPLVSPPRTPSLRSPTHLHRTLEVKQRFSFG